MYDEENILGYIAQSGEVTLPEIQQKFGLTYPKASKIVQKLQTEGKIKFVGGLSYAIAKNGEGNPGGAPDLPDGAVKKLTDFYQKVEETHKALLDGADIKRIKLFGDGSPDDDDDEDEDYDEDYDDDDEEYIDDDDDEDEEEDEEQAPDPSDRYSDPVFIRTLSAFRAFIRVEEANEGFKLVADPRDPNSELNEIYLTSTGIRYYLTDKGSIHELYSNDSNNPLAIEWVHQQFYAIMDHYRIIECGEELMLKTGDAFARVDYLNFYAALECLRALRKSSVAFCGQTEPSFEAWTGAYKKLLEEAAADKQPNREFCLEHVRAARDLAVKEKDFTRAYYGTKMLHEIEEMDEDDFLMVWNILQSDDTDDGTDGGEG